jgi:hypothetical protein
MPRMSRERPCPVVASGRRRARCHLLSRTGNYAASSGRCPRNARNAPGSAASHAA